MKKRNLSAFIIVLAVSALVTGRANAGGRAEGESPGEADIREAERSVPVTDVVLFSTGVGYFQRKGWVQGEGSMNLYFDQGDVNDLLKSMVLQDTGGGTITSVNYASREPLARTLKNLSVDIISNPGFTSILNQLRGERVQFILEDPTRRITGKVIGVEQKTGGDGTVGFYINVYGRDGIEGIPLSSVRSMKIMDSVLEENFRKALALLAEGNRTDKKRVTVQYTGEGKREIRIGYILGTPVWKASYRLVLGEASIHYLQGWAIVENTTEEEWRDVHLSLVSGRPVSFIMDLYRPVYQSRPTLQPETSAPAAVQSYEERRKESGAPAPRMAEPSEMLSEMYMEDEAYAEGFGAAEREMDVTMGVETAARGEQSGEFFQYIIEHPVSIPQKESAMVPIVGAEIEGERFSIYNVNTHTLHPFNALKLKNTTGVDLTAGPLTVFEDGGYAGDSKIGIMASGEERYISYSLDLKTTVQGNATSEPDRITGSSIKGGTLSIRLISRKGMKYQVAIRGGNDRTVMIEHPITRGWTLIEPVEPFETTATYYRFIVPEENGLLEVSEEHESTRSVTLLSAGDSTIQYYIDSNQVDISIRQALRGILQRRERIRSLQREQKDLEQKRSEIHREQARIRENLERLESGSDLYRRYTALLGQQEDQLEAIRNDIERLVKLERDESAALKNYVLSLQTD